VSLLFEFEWGLGKEETTDLRRSESFVGVGSGFASLECVDSTYQNLNWTIGQIYSSFTTTCKPVELTVKQVVTRV